MKVIGVVGQNGSGKDEVLKYLDKKYGVPYLATGDMVREIAAKEGLPTTRENLGKISERYFKQYGKGCFVRLLGEKIRQSGQKAMGISGIRSSDDIDILREMFGKDFILIDVYVSDPKERYSRMTKRGQARDPQSYEQFLSQEKEEEAIFHIKEAEQTADYSIANDGALDDLHREIDKLVAKGVINSFPQF